MVNFSGEIRRLMSQSGGIWRISGVGGIAVRFRCRIDIPPDRHILIRQSYCYASMNARRFCMVFLATSLMSAEADILQDRIVSLADRCMTDPEPGPVTEDVRLFVGGAFAENRPDSAGRSNHDVFPRVARDGLLREMGRHIRERAGDLANGLPQPDAFAKPHRLGPLFDGMLPEWYDVKRLELLAPLLPHLTREWMDLALACGAVDFHHAVRLAKGEIRTMLHEYERSEDDAGLCLLGRALAAAPGPVRDIRPEDLACETLVKLLSAALRCPSARGEVRVDLAMACAPWTIHHPRLLDGLSERVGERSYLPLIRIAREGLLANHGEAARLADTAWEGIRSEAKMVLSRLPMETAAEEDPAKLPAAMTVEQLRYAIDALSTSNRDGGGGMERVLPYLRELLRRPDVVPDRGFGPDPQAVRLTALKWWREGRDRDAADLLLCVFLSDLHDGDGRVELPEFSEIVAHLVEPSELDAAVKTQTERRGERAMRGQRAFLDWKAGKLAPPPWISRRVPEYERRKVLESMCGSSAGALAVFRSMPADVRMDWQAYLVLTGNEQAAEEPFPMFSSAFLGSGFSTQAEGKLTGHADPRGDAFSVYDGMVAVRDLLKAGQRDRSLRVFRDMLTENLLNPPVNGTNRKEPLRILIDGLADIPCKYQLLDQELDSGQMIAALIACWDMDDPELLEYLKREVRENTDTHRWYPYQVPLVSHLIRHGAHEDARSVALDQLASIGRWRRESRDLFLLAWADGMVQATAGDSENAVARLMACVKLSPEWTGAGCGILRALAVNAGDGAAEGAKAAVREYWKGRGAANPGDAWIGRTEARWLEMLENP